MHLFKPDPTLCASPLGGGNARRPQSEDRPELQESDDQTRRDVTQPIAFLNDLGGNFIVLLGVVTARAAA